MDWMMLHTWVASLVSMRLADSQSVKEINEMDEDASFLVLWIQIHMATCTVVIYVCSLVCEYRVLPNYNKMFPHLTPPALDIIFTIVRKQVFPKFFTTHFPKFASNFESQLLNSIFQGGRPQITCERYMRHLDGSHQDFCHCCPLNM